jgi:glycosyltransferase involved in cell wall biosynthesis
MKVSIVIPSFNQGAFITEAIASVVAQQYPAVEHIIVDNCSTDGTSNILKKPPS